MIAWLLSECITFLALFFEPSDDNKLINLKNHTYINGSTGFECIRLPGLSVWLIWHCFVFAVKTPDDNEFIKELRAGHCRLIPETPEEMQKMIDSTLYNKRKVPGQVQS